MLSVNLTHLIDDEKCYETVRHRQIAQELDLDKDVVQDMTTLPGDKQVHFLIEWLGCFLK